MKRIILSLAALVMVHGAVAMAQNSAALAPDGSCDCCQGGGAIFPGLQAMLAVHRTQAQYASFGGSCQKGCCQKGCVQKGCVQKGCLQKSVCQKPCAPKCCAPKCIQKPVLQKPVCQKSCAPKCSAPKCVQKPVCQKSVCQKSVFQKPCAPKCCAPKCSAPKGCCQKGVCQKGGCGTRRGLLLSLGLFNRGGKCCGKGSYGGVYGSGYGAEIAPPPVGSGDELPTPVLEGSNPFQDDPNPLRSAAYTGSGARLRR